MIDFLKSFLYAFKGIISLFKNDRNFKIHFLAFLLILIAGFYYNISKIEWLFVLIISSIVISLEAINSAIEQLCDLHSKEHDSRIETIKDIAAGAVLIAAIFAVAVGLIIFGPYILKILE